MLSVTFSHTGSEQTWTVPSGVYEVFIEADGAGGQGGDGGTGGYAEGTLTVTPGETLYPYVGGSGANDRFNGGANGPGQAGNGGGASDLRQGGNTLSDRVIVAGGGGGEGGNSSEGSIPAIPGGDGGGSSGGNGADSGVDDEGGHGGSQSSGGAGGTGSGFGSGGDSGSLGSGGSGGSYSFEGDTGYGGGGGGGYYGGGGGGADSSGGTGGAGGGGSGYIGGVSGGTTTRGGGNTGDGEIVVAYSTSRPAGVTVSGPTLSSLDGSWSWGQQTDPDHFNVYRSQSPPVSTSDTLVAQTADGSVRQITDSGRSENTTYYYAVSAVSGSDETDISGTGHGHTLAAAPVDLTVTSTDSDSIDLSWTAYATEVGETLAGYRLYRSQSTPVTTSDTLAATPDSGDTEVTDSGLLEGREYYYALTAILEVDQ